jgi:hypothetical protein
MARWEYNILVFMAGASDEHVIAELDRMGAHGWEVVAIVPRAEVGMVFYFKRCV